MRSLVGAAWLERSGTIMLFVASRILVGVVAAVAAVAGASAADNNGVVMITCVFIVRIIALPAHVIDRRMVSDRRIDKPPRMSVAWLSCAKDSHCNF